MDARIRLGAGSCRMRLHDWIDAPRPKRGPRGDRHATQICNLQLNWRVCHIYDNCALSATLNPPHSLTGVPAGLILNSADFPAIGELLSLDTLQNVQT